MKIFYDWRITLWKAILVFVLGGIGALIAWITGLPSTPATIAIIACLTALINFLKHS